MDATTTSFRSDPSASTFHSVHADFLTSYYAISLLAITTVAIAIMTGMRWNQGLTNTTRACCSSAVGITGLTTTFLIYKRVSNNKIDSGGNLAKEPELSQSEIGEEDEEDEGVDGAPRLSKTSIDLNESEFLADRLQSSPNHGVDKGVGDPGDTTDMD